MENNQNKKMERVFSVEFILDRGNIKTQMKNKNVSPQEAIGLLEMAKDQLLFSISKNRKEIFSASGNLDDNDENSV